MARLMAQRSRDAATAGLRTAAWLEADLPLASAAVPAALDCRVNIENVAPCEVRAPELAYAYVHAARVRCTGDRIVAT